MTIPENWASIDPNPCSNPHSLPLQTTLLKQSKKSQYSEEDEELTEGSDGTSESNSEDEDGTMNSDSGSECSSSSCSSSCSTCSDDEDSDSSSSSISTSDQHQQRKNHNKQQDKVNKQLKNSVNKNRFFVESRSVIKPRNSATATTSSQSAEFNFVDQNNHQQPVMSSTPINNISKGSISQAETSNHSQNSNSKASSKLVTVNHQSSPNLNKKKNSSSNASTNASTSTTRKFFKRRAQQQQQTVNNALVRCRLFMVPPYSFFFCHTAPNRIQNCVVVLKHSKITLFNLLSTRNETMKNRQIRVLTYMDAC